MRNAEEGSSTKILSPEDQAFETHYVEHSTRDSSGRYNVRLAFKHNCSELGDTYRLALRRFLSLKHSFHQKPTYKAQYQEFLCTISIIFDTAKMYRQITIHPEDRRYHKVLWKENINGTIKTYQLNTVTYETDFVQYLAIRTLQKLAQNEDIAIQ